MADWHSTVTPGTLARLLHGTRLPAPAGGGRPPPPPPRPPPPAYRTLAGQVRALICEGRLPVGSRLPAERELAGALSLSRTTIATAYEALRTEGYLQSRRGSGSWTTLPEGSSPPGDALHPLPPDESGRVLDLGVAALPAPQPHLGEAAARAVELLPAYAAGHGHYPTGLPVLREALARRFTARGLPTTPDQILVTTGAMGALHLLRRALVARGDRVAVEAPSYAHTLQSLRIGGARLVPVAHARPHDPTRPPGWDLPEWRRVLTGAAARLAYVIPDFHNPTGALIDEEQRRELLVAARAAGTVLLVDETMAELGWGLPEEERVRPTAALDRSAQVVTVGSASKLLWGGLRVGWVRAAPALVRRLATDRVYSDVGTPVLEQLIAATLIEERLAEVRDFQLTRLRESHRALAAELSRQLPDWRFAEPRGGLTLWADTAGRSGSALAAAGERSGVRIAAGSRFGVDGAFEGYVRIPLTVPAAGRPAVAVLTGPGGIGKTATAVRAAHHLCERFPDGQLHLDLRGSTPDPLPPAGLLAALLRAVLAAAGARPELAELSPRSFEPALAAGLPGTAPDLVACLLDESSFLPDRFDLAAPDTLTEHLERRLEQLATLAVNALGDSTATLVLHTVPLPRRLRDTVIGVRARGTLTRLWYRLNAGLLELAERDRRIEVVDLAGLLATTPLAARDERLLRRPAPPYTDGALLLLAHEIRRIGQARLGLSRRLLALGADSERWPRELCRTVGHLVDQGVMVFHSDHHTPDPVERVLSERPEVLLRPEVFSRRVVNWAPRAGNLRRAAETLGMGTESVVFLTASGFERGHVAVELPEVAVIDTGGDPTLLATSLISHGWFDVLETARVTDGTC
ncbi:hypothetical protein GCM10009665_04110 [Kitasatospora nipponensis]|uniref:HTH gntR-type domain-containing protein n=1 Tax=Kitasatospora nipponensis TaxID=258049 RepID=A0ABP4G8T2_9ACTN